MEKTILVVDDDPTILMITEMILKTGPYQVITAKSGLECLANLEQNRIDLLLLDLVMPFMDGFETLRRIRATPGLEHLPVFILTGEADMETVRRAKELGAMDYILKPPKQQYLMSKVEQLLGA